MTALSRQSRRKPNKMPLVDGSVEHTTGGKDAYSITGSCMSSLSDNNSNTNVNNRARSIHSPRQQQMADRSLNYKSRSLKKRQMMIPPTHPTGPSSPRLRQHQEEPQSPRNTTVNGNDRTMFHIRLSIGYLTGLRLIERKKQSSTLSAPTSPSNYNSDTMSNHLVLGFAELEHSGKFMALSQPILPYNLNGRKTTRVVWANSATKAPSSDRTGEGSASSKARRRLHFALPLERESIDRESRGDEEGQDEFDHHHRHHHHHRHTEDEDDDVSTGSQTPFVPEVVHLLVGLKCGDEKIPLGVAKLVVNGRETMEQKMDLAVQPFADSLAGGSSNKNNKSRRGIFGGKKKTGASKNHFTNGDHLYLLAPNATLRVKADIKAGYEGQEKTEIWGNDDSSLVTNWTFDTAPPDAVVAATKGAKGGISDVRDKSEVPIDQSALIGMAGSPEAGHLDDHEMPPPSDSWTKEYNQGDKDSLKDSLIAPDAEINTKTRQSKKSSRLPFEYVEARSPSRDVSELTSPDPGFDYDWYLNMCGCGNSAEASTTTKTRKPRIRRIVTEQATAQRVDQSKGRPGISIETYDSSSETSFDVEHIHRQTQRRHTMNLPDFQVETLDVTAKQYSDLREAQETLQRYSSRIGVSMEELLLNENNMD